MSKDKPGLSDAELANHPTVYGPDALKGQVAVISGGAGGIGRAIAILFARLGAHVVLVGRNRVKLDALSGEFAAQNLSASGHVADIREPEAVATLFDAVWATLAGSTSSSTAPAGSFRKPRSTSRSRAGMP